MQTSGTYFGSVCGRAANRIAGATYTVDGQSYQVESCVDIFVWLHSHISRLRLEGECDHSAWLEACKALRASCLRGWLVNLTVIEQHHESKRGGRLCIVCSFCQ